MRGRLIAVASIVAVIAMANAAAASAATLYVDDTGDDTANDCTLPSAPCETIAHALTEPGTADVIHLGGGTYDEAVSLDSNESLIEDSTFSGAADGAAVLDSTNAGSPAIFLNGTGTVSGLTIRSANNPVRVTASGTLSGNTFDDGVVTGQYGADVAVIPGVAPPPISPTISGNTFSDPGATGTDIALVLNVPGSAVVSGNTFAGYNSAIQMFSGSGDVSPAISGNEITGAHDSGTGILIGNSGLPTLTSNNIHSPGAGSTTAILLSQTTVGLEAGGTLSRNRIIGHNIGVRVNGNEEDFSLSSDLIAKATSAGLSIDQLMSTGIGATATNVTIVDTVAGPDVFINDTQLSLDSSIVGVGTPAMGVDGSGTATCTIDFSRGTGDDGCATGFTTAADPMFVNPAAGDYHLAAGSPMIDMGNTTAPPMGALDIDGDARGLAVAAQCTTPPPGRRDIGADEFITTCPPPVTATPPATTPPTAKKCKKGQKLKKGKCVKKKRRKKRK